MVLYSDCLISSSLSSSLLPSKHHPIALKWASLPPFELKPTLFPLIHTWTLWQIHQLLKIPDLWNLLKHAWSDPYLNFITLATVLIQITLRVITNLLESEVRFLPWVLSSQKVNNIVLNRNCIYSDTDSCNFYSTSITMHDIMLTASAPLQGSLGSGLQVKKKKKKKIA